MGKSQKHRGFPKASARSARSFEKLEIRCLLTTGENLLFLDGLQPSESMGVDGFMTANAGEFYYVANRAGQSELWKSDGTTLGTKNIDRAAYIHSPTVVGEKLYYVVSNANGTENLAGVSTDLTHINNLTDVAGTLYFTADDGIDGLDLWKYEPDAYDATLVHDFHGSLDHSILNNFTTVGTSLYFVVTADFGGSSLWKSDGTNAGTFEVTSLENGNGPADFELADVNGTLFFYDYHSEFSPTGVTVNARLWRTQATGFELVTSIPSGSLSELTDVDGVLYFAMWGAGTASDISLWKSDGTADGTVLVKAIDQRNFSSNGIPSDFTEVQGILYFTADDEVHGKELWRSDGTTVGTYMLRDTYPNYSGGFADSPAHLVNLNDSLYFMARSPQQDMALWKSDGTTIGTTVISAFNQSAVFVAVTTPINGPANDILYFVTDDGETGLSLWKSDGSSQNTRLALATGIPSLGITQSTMQGTELFFVPSDGLNSSSLWTTDGTANGTRLIMGTVPGRVESTSGWSHVGNLKAYQSAIYFTADDGIHGDELWISHGTPESTHLFADLATGRYNASPRNLTISGGLLYFTTNEGTKLWRSDGTDEGTYEFSSSIASGLRSKFTNLTDVDGSLFFLDTDLDFLQTSLWKSDGTLQRTEQVKQLHFPTSYDFDSSQPHPANEFADDFFAFAGALYFSTEDGIHGRELWRSDGTPEGTAMVQDINREFGVHPYLKSYPRDFVDLNGVLYFTADDGVHGRELWTSDGSRDGTYMVANIRNDSFQQYRSSNPSSLIEWQNKLYFAATDGGFEGQLDSSGYGVELWRSDGTSPGTERVKDIYPGAWAATPRELTPVSNAFYFSADDGTHGRSMWISDGTLGGTSRFADVNGLTWSHPHNLVAGTDKLFFVSQSSLWSLSADVPVPEITYKQRALVLNQDRLGYLGSTLNGDRWVFAANAGNEIRFDLGQTFGAVRFRLKGPQGWIGFDDLSVDSGTLTLPHSGRYELEATLRAGLTGTYSFRMDQATFTTLTIGQSYAGQIAGTGFAQMFQVEVPFDGVLATTLDNAHNSDNIEIYLRRGAPPTRNTYDVRRTKPGADHSLWLPEARAGTWYVLIYADYAPVPGAFTILMENPPVLALAITPTAQPNFEPTWIAIKGGGFDATTTVEFIGLDGMSRTPTDTEFVSSTSLQVLLDLGTWKPDNYRVVVHKGVFTHELSTPFAVTREPYKLETKLIVPSQVGFNIPIRQTIWIEYTNSGRIPLPAPLLKLTGSNGARLTDDETLAVPKRGFGTIPNVSSTVQVMGLGKSDMPWLLMPGETNRIPVYYLGLSEAGSYPDVTFRLESLTTDNLHMIDWSSQESQIKPVEMNDRSWELSFEFLQSLIGKSWGGYASTLANIANDKLAAPTSLTSLRVQDLWNETLVNVGSFVNLIVRPESLGLDALPDIPNYPNCPSELQLYNNYLALLGESSTLLSERLQLNQAADSLRTAIGQFYSTALSLIYDAVQPIVDRVAGLFAALRTTVLTIEAREVIADFLHTVVSDGTSALLRIGSGQVVEGLTIVDILAHAGLTPPLANLLSEFREGQEYAEVLSNFRFFASTFFTRIDTLSNDASAHNSAVASLENRISIHNGNVVDYEIQNSACVNNLPQINVQGTTVIEGDVSLANAQSLPPNATYAVFNVTLSEPSLSPVTFQWTTTGGFVGTALQVDDYLAVSGTAEFQAGATQSQVLVPIVGDVLPESNEYFFIYIFSPVGGVINAGVASARIMDDDAQGKLPSFAPGAASETHSNTVGSFDPNDIIGPIGYGPKHFVDSETLLAYTIRFENAANATAPAREITITNPLDADLDLNSLELTEITFANRTIFIPSGFDSHQENVRLAINGADILAEVSASINREARELVLTLRAIDPITGWFSEDPLVGLLYPENDTGRGQGSISYIIKPKAGLPTGTTLENFASIVFDLNSPINTPAVHNTIDATGPTSQVAELPTTTTSTTVTIHWQGQDDELGSGVASYDLYGSRDGDAFVPYALNTAATSMAFELAAAHTYAFYTVATDHVGNRQSTPVAAQASILVLPLSWQNKLEPTDVNANGVVSPLDALLVINWLNSHDRSQPLPKPSESLHPQPYFDVNGDGIVSPLDALLVINRLNRDRNSGSEGEGGLVESARNPVLTVRPSPVPFNLGSVRRARHIDGLIIWTVVDETLLSLLASEARST